MTRVCVYMQWLFLKLCDTQWTGSNQELTRDTDKFFKSKGNMTCSFSPVHSSNSDVHCLVRDC